MSDLVAEMAAFGASHHACYEYPDDTDIAKAQRAAFCAGAAWSAEAIERLRVSLTETIAEAVEHRNNIIEARALDFQGIANPQYYQTYNQEIARMDALIERARAALTAGK